MREGVANPMRAKMLLASLLMTAMFFAPSATASSAEAIETTGPICHDVNIPGGVDMGSRFCFDAQDPECILRETRTTVFGTIEFCWIRAP